jgi:hypothetical protein
MEVPDTIAESWDRYRRLRWYIDDELMAPIENKMTEINGEYEISYGHVQRKPPKETLRDSLKTILDYFWTLPDFNIYKSEALDRGSMFMSKNRYWNDIGIDTAYILTTAERYVNENNFKQAWHLVRYSIFSANFADQPDSTFWGIIESFENSEFSTFVREGEREWFDRRNERSKVRE